MRWSSLARHRPRARGRRRAPATDEQGHARVPSDAPRLSLSAVVMRRVPLSFHVARALSGPLPHYAPASTRRHRQIRVGRTSLGRAIHPHPSWALRRNTGEGTDVTRDPAVGVEGRVRERERGGWRRTGLGRRPPGDPRRDDRVPADVVADDTRRPGDRDPGTGPRHRGRVGPDRRDLGRPRAHRPPGEGAGGATGGPAVPGDAVPPRARGVDVGLAIPGGRGPAGPGRPGPRRWLRRHPGPGHAGVVRRAGARAGARCAGRRPAVRHARGCARTAGRDARPGSRGGHHAHTPRARRRRPRAAGGESSGPGRPRRRGGPVATRRSTPSWTPSPGPTAPSPRSPASLAPTWTSAGIRRSVGPYDRG